MMVIEESYSPTLVRHCSDMNMMIRQVETDILYSDAIDVIPCRYTYEETDVPIEPIEPIEESIQEEIEQ